jgi:hypothetical protein
VSKPEETYPDPLQTWSADLVAEVVTPLESPQAAGIAAAAAAAAAATTAGIGAGAVVAGGVAAKVIAAVVITATLATGIAAATGTLPDPLQSWVADLVDGIGIQLPRPEDVIPTISTTIPDLDTLPPPGITVPVVTLP